MVRNPYHRGNMPAMQIVGNKSFEPTVESEAHDWDMLHTENTRHKHKRKNSKKRQQKRNNRYAKEERLYGE